MLDGVLLQLMGREAERRRDEVRKGSVTFLFSNLEARLSSVVHGLSLIPSHRGSGYALFEALD